MTDTEVSQLHVSLKRPGLIPIRRAVVGELEFVPTLRWVSEEHDFVLPIPFRQRLLVLSSFHTSL